MLQKTFSAWSRLEIKLGNCLVKQIGFLAFVNSAEIQLLTVFKPHILHFHTLSFLKGIVKLIETNFFCFPQDNQHFHFVEQGVLFYSWNYLWLNNRASIHFYKKSIEKKQKRKIQRNKVFLYSTTLWFFK